MKSLVIVALAACTYAKETMVVREDKMKREMPIVEGLACKQCIQNTEDTEACIGYGASFVLGWDWLQIWYDNPQTPNVVDGYYKLQLEIYSKQNIGLELLAALYKAINLDLTASVANFKLAGFLSMTYFTGSRRTCFNLAYYIDDLFFSTNMNLQLGQCYKDIIKCVTDWSNWTGNTAKFLDDCRLSNPTNVSIYTYNYTQDQSTKYITELGDGTDTDAGCKPGLFWRGEDPSSVAGQM